MAPPSLSTFLLSTGKVTALFSPMLVPLALATLKTDGHLLTSSAFVFSVCLAAQTVNGPGALSGDSAVGGGAGDGAVSLGSKEEIQAMSSLVVTSNANRASRIALGATFFAGAALYNFRLRQQQQSADGGVAEGREWYHTAGEWTLTFVLVLLGTMWMATGYHGQCGRAVGPKPTWNPDGKGWRTMPLQMRDAFNAKMKDSRVKNLVISVATTLAVRFGMQLVL